MDSGLRDQTVKLDQKSQFMDSENAVTATKALKNCIAKYRSHAGSLPSDMKEEVKMVTRHIPCNQTVCFFLITTRLGIFTKTNI